MFGAVPAGARGALGNPPLLSRIRWLHVSSVKELLPTHAAVAEASAVALETLSGPALSALMCDRLSSCGHIIGDVVPVGLCC